MGYYGGRGARLVTGTGTRSRARISPTRRPARATDTNAGGSRRPGLTIPGDWPSGVYLGRLTTIPAVDAEPYWQSYVVFIVRDDRPADILFQCSDNTWQAYNRWPDHYSLYTHPRGQQGPWAEVSFDRPYGREAQHEGVVNDPLTFGSGEFLPLEFPLAYWLEQHGYDVTYCSNSDMLTPDRGLRVQGVHQRRPRRVLGHPAIPERRADARRGRSPALPLGQYDLLGHPVSRQQRRPAQPDHLPRRSLRRPTTTTPADAMKDHGPFPEHGPDEGLLMGARNVEPVNGGGDWIVVKPEHWIFEGTGVKKGDRIPGLIGWEYHGDPARIPGLEVVAEGTAWVGGAGPAEVDRDLLPGTQGQLRLQRLDDLLGPGPVVAAGPYASLVPLVAAARAG